VESELWELKRETRGLKKAQPVPKNSWIPDSVLLFLFFFLFFFCFCCLVAFKESRGAVSLRLEMKREQHLKKKKTMDRDGVRLVCRVLSGSRSRETIRTEEATGTFYLFLLFQCFSGSFRDVIREYKEQ